MTFFLICFVLLFFLMFCLAYLQFKFKEYLAKRKREEEQARCRKWSEKLEAERKVKKTAFYQKLSEYKEKYGYDAVIFDFGGSDYDFDKAIIVFSNSKCIFIQGKMLQFSEIIACELKDKQTVIKGCATSETTTDNANLLKRAGLGYLIGGVAGAIIGGSTSKQKTTTNITPDTIYHQYNINLYTNNLLSPLLVIDAGVLESTAERKYAFFKALISRSENK